MAQARKAEQLQKRKGKGVRNKPHFKKAWRKNAKTSKKNNAGDKVLTDASVGSKRKLHSDADKPENKQKGVAKKKKTEPLTKKQRREVRRKQQKNYETILEALKGWEKLRRHDLSVDDRRKLLATVMQGMSQHVFELSLKHDMARVVQCCLKYGSASQRTAIFNELKDHVLELSKLKYSKFIVKALLRYVSPKERGYIISALYGHVCKLIRHSEASEIVELAYNMYANAQQRTNLMQEFYGPHFALFKIGKVQSIGDILANDEGQKQTMLKHMKDALVPLLEKSVVKHSIVHHALLEFLLQCDLSSKAEMIELLREVVVHILHTKDGSRIGLQCLWYGNPKDRKIIVKSFKGFVSKICLEEHGHVVLLGLFDCVDDTVLVKKALLSEMIESLEEVASNTHGRRVLLYLLKPRCPQHFCPQFVSLLTPGDSNPHSKKSQTVRHKELLEFVSGPLIELVARKANEWVTDKPCAVLLLQTVTSAIGDVTNILIPLVALLGQDSGEDHLVNNDCGHWVVRRLLAIDNEKADKVDQIKQGCQQAMFAKMIIQSVPESSLMSWATTNRGSFVLCSLLQSSVPKIASRVADILSDTITKLKKGCSLSKGQEVLCKEFDNVLR